MNLTVKGKVVKVLPMQSGVSKDKGTPWASQDAVLEITENEKFTKKFLFTIKGKERIDAIGVKEGETITVTFDTDAHEHNGRWFGQNLVWKVDRD